MANNKGVAIRKRQQIDSSKKTMFAFIAGAAFLAGIALVVGIFLLQQIIFHGKIIAEKQTTVSRLDKNIKSVDELKNNMRALEANTALNSVKSSEDSNALRTILDALPDRANADALGASIKNKFLDTVDGIEINSLSIDSQSEGDESAASGNTLSFSFEATADANKIKDLLTKFERSIRVIDIDSLELRINEDGRLTASVKAHAYYEPSQTVELEKKVVKL